MFDLKKLIRIETDTSDLTVEVCLNQQHKET